MDVPRLDSLCWFTLLGCHAMPKTALTGMAWQGYFFDTEGNVFGIHQPVVNAK
jgi:hypothetical protein